MRARDRLARLHGDESGLKTLEVVAILAVAAICLGVVKLFWFSIKNFLVSNLAGAERGWNAETGQ